ncbi:MAG: LemA family protein [Chitinophagaceae bacterium]|nr:LemA family protein [Chitinophagaceae bacterium]MCW5928347.1 LemA family protein [Chitinophagaceae bacterium]
MKKGTLTLIIILGVILLFAGCGCGKYNGLVTADQEVKTATANIEAQYQRRADLYNSVIKTIEGSANFEKSTLKEVLEARSKATSITLNIDDPASLQRFQEAQAQLQGSFSRLIAVAENYPDLKTTQSFRDFQTQQEGTENRINTARIDFNNKVQTYNLLVRTFPGNIFAGIFGFKEKAQFQSDSGANKVPDINFDIK